jgi:DNA-binding MarR family transcriptional regulator
VVTNAEVEVPARGVIHALAEVLALTEPPLLRLWRSAGLTFSQRRVLHQLRGGPLGARYLAAATSLSAPSLTRTVDRLERSGLVRRAIDGADRRRIVVSLTPAGERVLANHRVFSESGFVAAARALDPRARAELVERLEELTGLARAEQEAKR